MGSKGNLFACVIIEPVSEREEACRCGGLAEFNVIVVYRGREVDYYGIPLCYKCLIAEVERLLSNMLYEQEGD